MRTLSSLALATAALLAVSCSSVAPVQVNAGDTCYRCRRTIIETRLAGEMIDARGLAYKFKAPGCMAKYLAEHPEEKSTLFVTDFATGHLVDPARATFVPVIVEENSMERDFRAYLKKTDAEAFASQVKAATLDWNGVLAKARS
jgi:NosL protein